MGQQSKNNSEEKKLIALGRVLQTLREEDNVDVLLDSTLSYLQAELEYSLIWIGFYDRLDHRILGKGGITPTGDNTFLKNKFFLQPGDLLEQVVIQQRPVGVANLAEELRAGEWRKAAANYNIKGTLLFPIRYRDRCFGVVLLGSPQWGISPRSEEKARLSILLGGLAAALNQIEVDWNRTRMKRPDEPMFRMLDRLPRASSMLQRLEAIVAETHQFVAPTRTSIFWFERERRYFWRRMSNRQGAIEATPAASGITVQESGGFYNALVADQTVSIGESRSSLKADITSRLLQRLGARSLIAAPIRLGDELLGFLGCEANEPRIWKEEEKNYIRAAAQLIALISPMEEMEAIVEQTKQDQSIAAEITTAITSEEDWEQTIKTCAEQLTHRLQVDRFLILLLDPEQQQFEICYQNHPVNRRPIGQGSAKGNQPSLPTLSQVDWQMLERSKEALGIEDLSSDLKLLLWRDAFLEAGVRSLLICNTSIGRPLTGILVATSENPRTWTGAEREIFRVVSQQLGLILNQWQLQRQVTRQDKAYQSLQWALTSINAASAHSSIPPNMGKIEDWRSLGEMEGAALQSVVTMLGAEVAALVSWLPGSDRGHILTTPVINHQFAINSESSISVKNDSLIQEALSADSLVIKNVSDLASTTRNWISGTGIGEVLAIALRTAPEHATLGVVVIGTRQYRVPTTNVLPMFGVLISQLAWSRRLLILTYTLAAQRQQLQCLNWYKHRLIEDFYAKTWSSGHRASGQEKSSANAIASISYMLSNEYWQIADLGERETGNREVGKTNPQPGDSIKLTTLLLRSMDRIDPVVKNRHIWTQIHDAGGNEKVPIVSLENNHRLVKIELIIYELLIAACDRCPNGGRIDIWYRVLGNGEWEPKSKKDRPISTSQLELSITDNGRLDPQLIADLQNIPSDELAPSSLNIPPGLHLRICQLLIQQMGGELNFYQMDDGRILSRAIVPI